MIGGEVAHVDVRLPALAVRVRGIEEPVLGERDVGPVAGDHGPGRLATLLPCLADARELDVAGVHVLAPDQSRAVGVGAQARRVREERDVAPVRADRGADRLALWLGLRSGGGDVDLLERMPRRAAVLTNLNRRHAVRPHPAAPLTWHFDVQLPLLSNAVPPG